jgi:chromosome transmission fidelity protein 4
LTLQLCELGSTRKHQSGRSDQGLSIETLLTVDFEVEIIKSMVGCPLEATLDGGPIQGSRKVGRVPARRPAPSRTSTFINLTSIWNIPNGNNDSSSSARQTCPYKRPNFSFVHARWYEVNHRWFEQYHACLQDRIRWRTYKYRRLPRAEYWRSLHCKSLGLTIDCLLTIFQDDFFLVGSEDGNVSKFSLETMAFDKYITRCSLPIRDVTLSSDGNWCAVSSDELVVKIIRTNDTSSVMFLREQPKPVKHLSFDPSGKHIALSCTDGLVYVYSLLNDEPELVRKIDGLIRTVETEDEVSSKVVWHPDGRAFAAPTATRDIQVMSRGDWENQRTFTNGHNGDITALAWSPNGAMLVSAAKDGKVLLWETKTQKVIAAYDYADVMDISWHPTKNLLSFTNTEGWVYIYNDFVPEDHSHLLKLPLQPAPFIHDPLSEISANARRPITNGLKDIPSRGARRGTPDSLDDILGSDIMGDEDDFVVDDDGAGYALGLNGNGKRPHGAVDPYAGSLNKRRNQAWEPQIHDSFQPGSTPWRGNRKYLCLNLIGFVWTVDQDTHNTITVEFYDHEFHRDFHFTDTFLYDKACLTENGTLFSCPSNDDTPATIFYRPHETWTARADWRTQLPKGEEVTAMSLSDSFITVTTSAQYVRIYTLFGIPYRVYRQKSSPTVTCASWRDYVLTLGNGPVGADGNTKLLYTIQNIKRDEICQSEDVVALPEGKTIKSVFFSANGVNSIVPKTLT